MSDPTSLRRARRDLQRRLRHAFSKPLMRIALAVGPRLYLLYMRFVFATSRIEPGDFPRLHDIIREHDGAVGLLWHEEVFTVAYGYAHLRFRPHTLASLGASGEIITRMLKLCGFVVFRGGSSRKKSRRRTDVIDDMVMHMQANREVIYGITVDGSKGPPYRMKRGGVLIAARCRRPVVLARTWYRRAVRLPTWDRTAIPLPFNRIAYSLRGPYFPPDPVEAKTLKEFLLRVEDDLIDLAAESYREMGQALPAGLVKRTPEEREALEVEA